jgi:GntR family transcriptional regulator
MIQFRIQAKSDIPVSKQLFDQIQFAIATRQYPPGYRLPSTRQLAQITHLHRNTINKVYRQLEQVGLVESLVGSGVYVKAQEKEINTKLGSPLLQQDPSAKQMIQQTLDNLLTKGYSLKEVRKLFLAEIDWRLKCNALVIVTVPEADLGAGKLMVSELEQALSIPVQLVPIEDLSSTLENTKSVTVVTSNYFIQQVLETISPQRIRVITLDIYDYNKELEIIKHLPKDSCLGIVSLSVGILRGAEILVKSLRGEELFVMTSPINDQSKLKALIHRSHTIITDTPSYPTVKNTILQMRDNLIRPPQLIRTSNYISHKSIDLLKREFLMEN